MTNLSKACKISASSSKDPWLEIISGDIVSKYIIPYPLTFTNLFEKLLSENLMPSLKPMIEEIRTFILLSSFLPIYFSMIESLDWMYTNSFIALDFSTLKFKCASLFNRGFSCWWMSAGFTVWFLSFINSSIVCGIIWLSFNRTTFWKPKDFKRWKPSNLFELTNWIF